MVYRAGLIILTTMTDVSVLMLFFNRADSLQQVFEAVRQAQPARLFLYQDGPRGERDLPGIEACRRVVENIDWPCEVHRLYQEKNYGCDPSGFMSQQWAFSLTDKCIVLEDDVVPSPSFFPFCKEMLDRYENDERIGMIAGLTLTRKRPTSAPTVISSPPISASGDGPRGAASSANDATTMPSSIRRRLWRNWKRSRANDACERISCRCAEHTRHRERRSLKRFSMRNCSCNRNSASCRRSTW